MKVGDLVYRFMFSLAAGRHTWQPVLVTAIAPARDPFCSELKGFPESWVTYLCRDGVVASDYSTEFRKERPDQ